MLRPPKYFFPLKITNCVHFLFHSYPAKIFLLFGLLFPTNFTTLYLKEYLRNSLEIRTLPGKEIYVPHAGYKSNKKENIRTAYVTGKLHNSNKTVSGCD